MINEIEWQRALDKRYAEAKSLAAFVKAIELPDCIAIGEINAEDEYAVHHTTLQHIIVWAKTERGIKAGITRVANRAAKLVSNQ